MNKKTLEKSIVPLIILIGVVVGAYYLFIRTSGDEVQSVSTTIPSAADIQEYFNEQLRKGVIDTIGQPIHGFVPSMFTEVFSGIVLQDFGDAHALGGEYKIIEKNLVFIMDESAPITSAAEMLSDKGMETLFLNILERARRQTPDLRVATTDAVDGLLLFLGGPLPDIVVTKCLLEQRNVDACIEIYQPVCGNIDGQPQKTFSNSCNACANPLVISHTKGECSIDQ